MLYNHFSKVVSSHAGKTTAEALLVFVQNAQQLSLHLDQCKYVGPILVHLACLSRQNTLPQRCCIMLTNLHIV